MKISDEDYAARQRLLSVKDQIQAFATKGASTLNCPYCGETNVPSDEGFCCDLLRRAVIAILVSRRQTQIEDNPIVH